MGLSNTEKKTLKDASLRIREGIVNVTYTCGGSHIGGALSQTDIMVALYYNYMNIDPTQPLWEQRDRFVLSKGHGGVGHAVLLADKGYFDAHDLKNFNKTGSPFGMHLDWQKVKGVDASTGSLGHGLSISIGMALGAKKLKQQWRVYTVLGDGELHGGPNWEAAISAPHFQLDNLTAFVDYNHLCLDGNIEDIMPLAPLKEKWTSFGWHTIEIDGHNFDDICSAIEEAQGTKNKPTVIIANTIKGKGVDFMENEIGWHYAGLDEDMRDKALAALRKGQ